MAGGAMLRDTAYKCKLEGILSVYDFWCPDNWRINSSYLQTNHQFHPIPEARATYVSIVTALLGTVRTRFIDSPR